MSNKLSRLGGVMMIPGRTVPEIQYSGTHKNDYIVASKEKDQVAISTYERHGGAISIANSTCRRITIDFF